MSYSETRSHLEANPRASGTTKHCLRSSIIDSLLTRDDLRRFDFTAHTHIHVQTYKRTRIRVPPILSRESEIKYRKLARTRIGSQLTRAENLFRVSIFRAIYLEDSSRQPIFESAHKLLCKMDRSLSCLPPKSILVSLFDLERVSPSET